VVTASPARASYGPSTLPHWLPVAARRAAPPSPTALPRQPAVPLHLAPPCSRRGPNPAVAQPLPPLLPLPSLWR